MTTPCGHPTGKEPRQKVQIARVQIGGGSSTQSDMRWAQLLVLSLSFFFVLKGRTFNRCCLEHWR